MSRTLLFECSPRRPADGVVVPLRLAFKCVGPATHLGVQWEPLVETPPTFESAIGFDGRDLGASPIPQVGELVFAMTERTRAVAGLVWKNAAVTIRMALWGPGGARPADAAFATVWTGFADDIAVSAGRARVTMIDAGQLLRAPAITTKFGSSGDALLDSADALKDRSPGTVVPQAWGRVLSIPGLLVDRVNGIWLFANSPAASVQAFYDGGAAFTLGTARASLAALQANIPAAGAVDYCLNSAGKLLARPWSTPVYPFTAAATFGASNRIADIAAAIVSARGGPAFKAGAVATFNGVMAADAGLYLDDDTTIAAALDRLFSGVGAWWKLTSTGTIDCRQLGFAASALNVPAHRRGAPERQRIVVPTARRSIGYARNDRVHSEGEIAAIILAGDVSYADGTSIEVLKPAQAGANVTALNTAAAIAGQGALATLNSADWSSQVIGTGKPAHYATQNRDGQNLIPDPVDWSNFWTSGATPSIVGPIDGWPTRYAMLFNDGGSYGSPINPGAFNIAVVGGTRLYVDFWNYFTGSDIEVRLNLYASGGEYLNTIEFSGSQTGVSFGATGGTIYRKSASMILPWSIPHWSTGADTIIAFAWPHWAARAGYAAGHLHYVWMPYLGYIQRAADVTGSNTAAAITGQGALATRNRVRLGNGDGGVTNQAETLWMYDADLITNQGTSAAIAGQGAMATQPYARSAVGWMISEGYDFWLTNGVIVTNQGTAAAITGQGALATRNTIDFATDITGVPPGFGQQTVGNGQSIQMWMTNGQSVAVSGAHGATTGSFGNRSATLLANGAVFATGAPFLVAVGEPNFGEVSGTYTHSGASQVVSFTVGYSGPAYTIDTTKIFCRA